MKRQLTQLVSITLLGIALRLIGILSFPVTFDEAYNILLPKTTDIALIVKGAAEVHPPLYFYISHFGNAFSQNLLFIRSLSLFFGISTILSIAYIGQKIFNKPVGLIAAFLMAISPSHIYYSSIARMYSLGILESLFVIYFFIKFLNKKSGVGMLSLFLITGLYTHYFFLILLLALNVYMFINWRKTKDLIRQWVLSNLIIMLLFIPAILVLLSTTPSISVPANSILKLPVFYSIPQIPWDLIQTLKIFQYNQLDLTSLLAILISLLSLSIVSFGVFFNRSNTRFTVLSFIYIVTPLIILVISYSAIRIAALRSFILFSPLFFLILAATLTNLTNTIRITILVVLTSLTFLFFVSTTFFSTDAMKQIYENLKKEDVIVYNDVTIFLPSKILKPNGRHFLLYPSHLQKDAYKAIDVRISKISDIPISKRIWYIKQETNWPPYEKQADQLERYLHNNFSEINRSNYYKFQLILYEKNIK